MARQLLTAADFKELPIPQGLVAWWAGTYTSIPAGWEIADGQVSVNDPSYTKPSLCNGRFPKEGVPGYQGGASNHAHNVANHNHGGTTSSNTSNVGLISTYQIYGTRVQTHTHPINSASGTSDTQDHTPPYVEAIPIVYTVLAGSGARAILSRQDFASDALLPLGIIAGLDSDTIPPGWALCYGGSSNGVTLPNLAGKYLKGVPSTGTPPGTTGGANTHSHTFTHGHTSGGTSGTSREGGDINVVLNTHTHTASSDSPAGDAQSNEPLYRQLRFIAFVGFGPNAQAHPRGTVRGVDLDGRLLMARGVVVAWTSSSTPPTGYAHCDGGAFTNGNPPGYSAKPNTLGRFIKHVPNSTTNGGATGGAATHTHTTLIHTHTTGNNSSNVGVGTNAQYWDAAPDPHTHSFVNATGSWNGDNDPAYVLAAFIVRD